MAGHGIFCTPFADIYPLYVAKAERKGRTGVVCGVRVEEVEDPLMQRIRWMDKLVDELAKGKKMEKILRG